ncbi:MAG: ABC transporter permease, partial [Cyclobacteriaceae bacterium]|nr:ABC transporter permease [Cyclobacteriaceae bacterium]
MIRHFLITVFRHFYRTRMYSLVNITGLSFGISVSLLLFIWMKHENSYDQFHEHKDRIFRITKGEVTDENAWVGTPAPLADHLSRQFPEIESCVRIITQETIFQANEKIFNERNTFLADSNFFKVFSFELITGSPETVLKDPYSIVLTQRTAEKYYGKINPTGQTVKFGDVDLKITGIAADPPLNSHFHFDLLARFDLFYEILDDKYMDCWGCFNFMTYLLLKDNADPQALESKIRTITGDWEGNDRQFESLNLQPLTDIHYEYIRGNIEPVFNRKYIVIYTALILIILIMAAINFVNLNVAIAPIRYKEVGIKKTFGANRFRLAIQFITESILAALIAFFLAIILSEIFLPSFNRLIGKQLDLQSTDPALIGLLTTAAVFLGLVIGIYPAVYTSSASVSRILQGTSQQGKKSWFKNSLVVFQFIFSVIFIVSAIILNKQLHFIRHQQLGFDREHVFNISFFPVGIKSPEDLENYRIKTELFRNSLQDHSAIRAISINNFRPSTLNRNHGMNYENQPEDQVKSVFVISGDKDFADTYQIEILSGHEKIDNFEFNGTYGYILNESAVEAIGWDQPIDKFFSIFGEGTPGKVLGVCRDFHYRSFHHEIGPCVILLGEPGTQISLRTDGNHIENFIKFARQEYAGIFPGTPFEYFFV